MLRALLVVDSGLGKGSQMSRRLGIRPWVGGGPSGRLPEASVPVLRVNPPLWIERFHSDYGGKSELGLEKNDSFFESALFPVTVMSKIGLCHQRQSLGGWLLPPECGEGASPCWLSADSPRIAAGLTSQAWAEQAAGPLLTDVISFDGPRLRLFFQLGLLADSGGQQWA